MVGKGLNDEYGEGDGHGEGEREGDGREDVGDEAEDELGEHPYMSMGSSVERSAVRCAQERSP